MKKSVRHPADHLFDFLCLASVIGIWPRYIEPNFLHVTRLRLPIQALAPELEGLKILQLSDLHLKPETAECFLDQILKAASLFAPDLIVCTGDFLCYSRMTCGDRLRHFLSRFQAPYGCYAILGNHDYAETVSINSAGDYDILEESTSMVQKGMTRLFSTIRPTGRATDRVRSLDYQRELVELLKETPFELLDNTAKLLQIKGASLNIVGLGEYSLGKCRPEEAFKLYDERFPGLLLTHNPDSIPMLKDYPGQLILSGHTHGGQINLPWVWQKLTVMENPAYRKGLHKVDGKWLYVSRGLGSVMNFRWFAPPEAVCITLEKNP